ncbi:MAG TPA: hypothetical protein DGF10_08830 [Acidimicrobiaceae bacterium]|nr:hypothetical protein [Acidimicrobiaceae bacterium]HCV34754.1 hypothetical protein [Acidimicrobiaceae bacterium]
MRVSHPISESNECSFVKSSGRPQTVCVPKLSHLVVRIIVMDRTDETRDALGVDDVSAPILVIDCDDCIKRKTETCDDCMVTFLCERVPGDAVVVALDEYRALRVIEASGLLPPLRHTVDTPVKG